MLIQHRQVLGHKKVDKITVFDYNEKLMLLYHIVDVEPDTSVVTTSKPSQSNSHKAMAKKSQLVQVVIKTRVKRSTRTDTDEEYEYGYDVSESATDYPPQGDVEKWLIDDGYEAWASADYVYESESESEDEDEEMLDA